MYPLVTNPTSHVVIFLTGSTAATNSYTLDASLGTLTFSAGSEPADGATILGQYKYHALSSGEVSECLSGLTATPLLAASKAALMLAGDSSRYFAYTMGDKTVDKSKVQKQLLDLSDRLKDRHYELIEKGSYDVKWFTLQEQTGWAYWDYDTGINYTTS